jgi:hypothetical protein
LVPALRRQALGAVPAAEDGVRSAPPTRESNGFVAAPTRHNGATIYQHLGIDPRGEFNDFTGRPIPILSAGLPIRELG